MDPNLLMDGLFFNENTIIAAFVGMSAAIGELYRRVSKSAKTIEYKLEACEKKHSIRDKEQLQLSIELARLKGNQEGINSLARQVLEVVKENTNRQNSEHKQEVQSIKLENETVH